MNKKQKSILIFGGIALVAIIIGTILGINYFIKNTLDVLNFKVIAEKMDNSEIPIDTNFIISSEKDYSLKLMKKIVRIEPSIDYTISRTDKGKYVLATNEQLKDDALYNVYIDCANDKPAFSWAFQTKVEFKVNSTTPYENNTFVNRNSGIEINFSKPISDIDNYFEIFPKVSGKFEYLDKRAIFIPSEELKADTVYKVMLKKGLKSSYGDELLEEYDFSFRTKNDIPYFYLNDYQSTMKATDEQAITVYSDNAYNGVNFKIDAYELKSAQEYLSYLETHYKNIDENIGENYDHNFDITKRTKVFSHNTTLVDNKNWGYKMLILPYSLPNGWYILDVTNELNSLHFQKMLQISDISTYIYGLDGDVRIWLNDSETGTQISGATVQLGNLAAISNKDGIANFNISSDKRQKIMVTTKEGKEFAEYVVVSENEEKNLNEDYYMYFYTDRNNYLPNDTINYWGVIIPRKSNVKIPVEIKVEFFEDLVQTVKVDKNGTFSGNADIVNRKKEWSYSKIIVGDKKSNCFSGFQIVDYTKPVYKLSSEFNKKYYRGNENLDISVYGSFYDGTSAENVKVKVSADGNDEYKTVTLNANGEARTTLKPYKYSNSDEYLYNCITLEVAGIDESATAYNGTFYFPTDYHVEYDWDYSYNKLTLSTNKANYKMVNWNNIDYKNLYTGESFNQNVKAEVVEVTNEKRYTGNTSYDYYTGTYKMDYVYDRVENVINTYSWDIEKGKKFEVNIPEIGQNEEATYEIKLSYTLPDGYVANKTIYAWNGNSYSDRNYYYFSADKYSLVENESTKISLKGDCTNNGKLLYIVSNDRINTVGVTSSDYLDVKMSKELIPNFEVYGAYFDGTKVYNIRSLDMSFDTKERKLSIDITTDKESYKPGDTVKASAKVTDKNGKPVESNFLFSVVDESALYNQYDEEILNYIYEYRYHSALTFVSDNNESFDGGGAGDGGEEVRDTFADVLSFLPLRTNGNGEASIEFKTADNLTSWRITGIAISDDVKAGMNHISIKTTIPFFINQVLNSKYLEGDDVVFSLRTVGANASLISSKVEYEITLLNDLGEIISTTKELAIPTETFMRNLGKLSVGKYKLKVSAKAGDNSDAILKEFEVVNSLHEISLTQNINDISKLKEIIVKRYPVKLTLVDSKNGLYYKTLQKIIECSNGRTNEQLVAKNFANKKLNEFLGEEKYDTEFNSSIQGYNGVVKINGSAADALLSAQIVANLSEYVNVNSMKSYFEGILEDSNSITEDVTAAYMGLAALKEPVLADVNKLLEDDSFEVLDIINLIDSLAYIGDYDSAVKYYEKKIQPIMEEKDDEKFVSPNYETLYYQATSRILPMLALTQHKDFEKVLNYVINNETKEYIPVTDLACFIKNYNPIQECTSKIEYSILDKKVKVDFSKEKIKTLLLNKDEYDSFNVKSLKGDVVATIEYIGEVNEIIDDESDVKITKVISNREVGGYSDVVMDVTLPDDKNDYIVNDVIPNSSRYVSSSYEYGNYGVSSQEGQRISFYISRNRENNKVKISYKIRNIFDGDFVIEPVYVVNSAGKIVGSTK